MARRPWSSTCSGENWAKCLSGGALQDIYREKLFQNDSFTVEGRTFGDPSNAFFGVFSYPSGRLGAVFLSLSPAFAEEVAGKLTHYGRYSYLGFPQGKNEVKGIWPVTESPLMVTWDR